MTFRMLLPFFRPEIEAETFRSNSQLVLYPILTRHADHLKNNHLVAGEDMGNEKIDK